MNRVLKTLRNSYALSLVAMLAPSLQAQSFVHPGCLITSNDIARMKAKAAIGAGIEVSLEKAGLQVSMLDRVYVAGGFGMHLNVHHATQIDLLPGVRREQVEVVGNASLAGSVLALLDHTTLEEMERLRRQVEVIELNLQDGFEDRYIDHLSLR